MFIMPYRRPYFLCEDVGGRGFWKVILERIIPDCPKSNYSIQYLPGLFNVDAHLEQIGRTMLKRINRQSPLILFLIDADVYLKKYKDLTYNETNVQIESKLTEMLRNKGYVGNIKCVLIKNCLESLICCDLEVIWRTNMPPVKSDLLPNPIPLQYDCNTTNNCPLSQLKDFIKEFCKGDYKKTLHPEKFAKAIDIRKLNELNFSFKNFIDILTENQVLF